MNGYKKTAEELEREIRGLRQANGGLKARNAKLDTKNRELLEENVALRKSEKALERDNARLKIKSDDLRQELTASTEQVIKLQAQRNRDKQAHVQRKQELAYCEAELRKLKQDAITPSASEMHLRGVLATLYTRLTAASDIIIDRDFEIATLKARLDESNTAQEEDPGGTDENS